MENKIKDIAIISISIVLLAISSWIEIPFVIPFTLQSLVIFVMCGLFTFKISFISIVAYILIGLLGIPVFARFNNGLSALLNYTGGFIFSFVIVPIVFFICNKMIKNEKIINYMSSFISLIIMYLFGLLWFYIVYCNANPEVTLLDCLLLAVLPFIIPDIIKIFISDLLIKKLKTLFKNEAF